MNKNIDKYYAYCQIGYLNIINHSTENNYSN